MQLRHLNLKNREHQSDNEGQPEIMGRVFAFGLYLRKNCRLDFAMKFLTRDYASHSTQ